MYGHPGLLAKANTTMITNLPVVKPGDPQSLSRYVGRLNDVVTNLNRTGQAGELKSTIVVKIATAKLPRDHKVLMGGGSIYKLSSNKLGEFEEFWTFYPVWPDHL